MCRSRVVQRLLRTLQAVQLLDVYLLLLDLCIFLNLLAIKHILIGIWRLTETAVSTLAAFLLLYAITSDCEALVLLILHRIGLMTCLHGIRRLLAAQKMLISGLASNSV